MTLRVCKWCKGEFWTTGTRLYCLTNGRDTCWRKAKAEAHNQAMKERNALRTLIAFFHCKCCGQLGVRMAVGKPRLYRRQCLSRYESERQRRMGEGRSYAGTTYAKLRQAS